MHVPGICRSHIQTFCSCARPCSKEGCVCCSCTGCKCRCMIVITFQRTRMHWKKRLCSCYAVYAGENGPLPEVPVTCSRGLSAQPAQAKETFNASTVLVSSSCFVCRPFPSSLPPCFNCPASTRHLQDAPDAKCKLWVDQSCPCTQDRFLQRRAGQSPGLHKRPGPLPAMGHQAPEGPRKRLAAAFSLETQGRAHQGPSFQAPAAELGNTSDEGETMMMDAPESLTMATPLRCGSRLQGVLLAKGWGPIFHALSR